jgi:hypothetical protein
VGPAFRNTSHRAAATHSRYSSDPAEKYRWMAGHGPSARVRNPVTAPRYGPIVTLSGGKCNRLCGHAGFAAARGSKQTNAAESQINMLFANNTQV